ncbi:MAG: serine hydrolase [Hyphomicrobiaceae bacterium]
MTDSIGTLANWRTPPFNRQSFTRVRELIPTANIAAAPLFASPLPRRYRDFSSLSFQAPGGPELALAHYLETSAADALVVLQRGKIVYDWYRTAETGTQPHVVFSVSKSLTALLAGILVADGVLDADAPITRYVPEVGDSAYADATVRHLLDMTVSINFTEDYLNPDQTFLRYRAATGWNFRTAGSVETLHDFLATLQKDAYPHGDRFRYKSPNSDLLGWVLERAGRASFAQMFSDRIWQPMGAASDAYVTVDPAGAPRTAGGICVTVEDLARVGEMVRCRGFVNGRQVIPGSWIDDITSGGNIEHWTKGDLTGFIAHCRYRSKWYNHLDNGTLLAAGIHGQWLVIDPKADLVIAKQSSQPEPSGDAMDHLNLAAFDALSAELI